MNIYLAGPDVFRPNALQWAESARALLDEHGHRALIPLDNEETTAEGIFTANLALISEADVVIANLKFCRDQGRTSATAFNICSASEPGKRVPLN